MKWGRIRIICFSVLKRDVWWTLEKNCYRLMIRLSRDLMWPWPTSTFNEDVKEVIHLLTVCIGNLQQRRKYVSFLLYKPGSIRHLGALATLQNIHSNLSFDNSETEVSWDMKPRPTWHTWLVNRVRMGWTPSSDDLYTYIQLFAFWAASNTFF